MKDANSAPNWMRFAYKAIKDFGSDQVVDLEDLDDLEEIDDALESALDDPSGLDCERFGRGELTYGQFISTLLLCRDLETTSIDPFRPRSVTVIRSPLSFKHLCKALRVLCPEDLFLIEDGGYRSGRNGTAV